MHRDRVRLQEVTRSVCVPLMVALLAGCSSQYWFAPPAIRQVALRNLAQRRVAVVFEAGKLDNRYEASNGGHDFAFEEMRSYFKQAFLRTLQGVVKDVGFENVPGYDAYIRPELAFTIDGSLSKSCFADFKITIVDRAGKQLARGEGRGEDTFMRMADGGAACEIALARAITIVWNSALPALDAAFASEKPIDENSTASPGPNVECQEAGPVAASLKPASMAPRCVSRGLELAPHDLRTVVTQ